MSVPQTVSGLPAVSGPPSPSEWDAMRQQAEVIARSGMAPRSVSTPEKILVIAMKGRELSLPPMQALSHIHIVEGKPTLSAELMVALVQRAGHKLRVVETSSERCVVQGVRANDPAHPSEVAFSMEDAKRAGVAGKGPWKSYPAAMLRARAISALCRFQFADVLMGASYTPEELGQNVNEEGEVVEQAAPVTALPSRVNGNQNEFESSTEHDELLEEIRAVIGRMPEHDRPDDKRVRAFASESLTSARRTLAKLKKLKKDAETARQNEEEARDIEDAEIIRGSNENEGFSDDLEDLEDLEFTDEEIDGRQ